MTTQRYYKGDFGVTELSYNHPMMALHKYMHVKTERTICQKKVDFNVC